MGKRSMILDTDGRPMRRISSGQSVYDAGGVGRRTRGFFAPGTGPTDAAVGNAQNLRNRSRAAYRNGPWAKSAVNKLVSNIIGTGIRPRWNSGDRRWDKRIQHVWKKWVPESDPEGLLSFYGQQGQGVNTWMQGGEAFLRMRPRRASDGLTVPLQMQVMEPELCPIHHNGTNGANRIRHGIEFDPIGRRVAYWFYGAHPGDMAHGSVDASRLRRVPASEVIHLFDPVRPGQIRGTPQLAQVLLSLHEINKFADAVRLRQQISNLFTAFITREADEDDDGNENPFTGEPVAGDDEIPEVALEPGIVQELGNREDVTFSDPPDAGANYADYMRTELLAAAAGGEVPYEVLTGDFSEINERTARVLLNEFRRRVQQMQTHIVVHQLCRRVIDQWIGRAVLSGAIAAPNYAEERDRYHNVSWVPQAWPYIHPEQDVKAHKASKRSGFKTQAQIVNETTGEDIDDVYDRLAEENAMADERGLVLDTDPRRTDASGKPAKPRDAEDGDDPEADDEEESA